MNYLLDTHVLIWGSIEPEKISKTVQKIIDNKDSHIFVSVASIWEFAIKHSRGKLSFEGGLSRLYEIVRKARFNILPIKQSYISGVIDLPFIHRDPFDRMLIATAKTEHLTILTIDENIHKYDVPFIW